jgi:hypothetical protein
MALSARASRNTAVTVAVVGGQIAYRLSAPGGGPEDDRDDEPFDAAQPAEREDLPFRVELWDEAKSAVEQVLAVTASGSIGYAAYYAAVRDFPLRYITLRHKSSIVSRWNGPNH